MMPTEQQDTLSRTRGAETSTSHAPEGPWAFDEHVTRCFDDMIARSIPGYADLRDTTTRIAAAHLPSSGGHVIDLGASLGGASERLVERYGSRCRFTLAESSPPMIETLTQRYEPSIESGIVRVEHLDLRRSFPEGPPADVVLCVLTLQFVPVTYRPALLRRMYDALRPGGVLLLSEKLIPPSAHTSELLTRLYHDVKREHGYSEEAVRQKSESLEGVLVPLSASANEEMIRAAGFGEVECYWRSLLFGAWLAVK